MSDLLRAAIRKALSAVRSQSRRRLRDLILLNHCRFICRLSWFVTRQTDLSETGEDDSAFKFRVTEARKLRVLTRGGHCTVQLLVGSQVRQSLLRSLRLYNQGVRFRTPNSRAEHLKWLPVLRSLLFFQSNQLFTPKCTRPRVCNHDESSGRQQVALVVLSGRLASESLRLLASRRTYRLLPQRAKG